MSVKRYNNLIYGTQKYREFVLADDYDALCGEVMRADLYIKLLEQFCTPLLQGTAVALDYYGGKAAPVSEAKPAGAPDATSGSGSL